MQQQSNHEQLNGHAGDRVGAGNDGGKKPQAGGGGGGGGGSYVPPHLRTNSAPVSGSGHDDPGFAGPPQQSFRTPRGGFNGGGGGGGGGGHNFGRPSPRYGGGGGSNYNSPRHRGGGGGGGGYGNRGGGGGRWKNHSVAAYDRTTTPNPRLEAELFDAKNAEVSQGINFDKYDDIPVETSGNDVAEPIAEFKDIDNMHPQLLWNIDRAGFTKPTPVQKHSFPIGVSGRDLMVSAQTGSGKTAAFLFPMIQMLLESGGASEHGGSRFIGQSSFSRRMVFFPVGLVLSPTRELALQIYAQARKFLYCTGMRACVVYGGMDTGQQFRDLEKGVDIVVATPGRLTDLLQRGRMNLGEIRYMILDEADRMLDMGFEPQIREILSPQYEMPAAGERQTMMFSATFPKPIQFLAQDFLGDYVFIAVGRVGSTTESITQKVEYAEDNNKQQTLLRCLGECEGLTLIFVQKKRSADEIEYFLHNHGVTATSIHGDRNQREREHALNMFKNGMCPVLVATDVASRGLDIPNVTHVFNFDMPNTIDDYVHRIGRTGRCGNVGTAISFVSPSDNRKVMQELIRLLDESNQHIPDWLPKLARSYGGGGGGRRGRGRGGSKFGGRDVRRDHNRGGNLNSRSYGGGRGGGGGGGWGGQGGGGGGGGGGGWGGNDSWRGGNMGGQF